MSGWEPGIANSAAAGSIWAATFGPQARVERECRFLLQDHAVVAGPVVFRGEIDLVTVLRSKCI